VLSSHPFNQDPMNWPEKMDEHKKRPSEESEEEESSVKKVQTFEGDFESLLGEYYLRAFPFEQFCKWLGYFGEEENYLANREFSFTLKDDIYIRYRSFTSQHEFKEEVIKINPYKIDIGAVYNHQPRDHKTVKGFQPMEKELVFDIDLTDYDDIRTCCSEANICQKCWQFMAYSVKILDVALRDDFGFEHVLFVYSGRRGVHCWVSDKRARMLSNDARTAVAEYLTVLRGGDQQAKKVKIPGNDMHPALSRAFDIINETFEKYVVETQDILGDESRWKKILSMVSDKGIQDLLEGKWSKKQASSTTRWNELKACIIDGQKRKKGFSNLLKEIIFQYSYPRLDINVSKQVNHLLKAPFCVHPKTGRVCVPINVDTVDEFNPEKVPTVSLLIGEINEYNGDIKKTSLSPYLKEFDLFLKPIGERVIEAKRDKADKKLEF